MHLAEGYALLLGQASRHRGHLHCRHGWRRWRGGAGVDRALYIFNQNPATQACALDS
jgi:hypothetical protein